MPDTPFAGVLVGYPTDTYGYLIYNPKTRKVITTRHVGFDETFNGRLSEEGKTMPPAIESAQSPVQIIYTSSDDDNPANPPTNVMLVAKQHNAPMITSSPGSNSEGAQAIRVHHLRPSSDPKVVEVVPVDHLRPGSDPNLDVSLKTSSTVPTDDDESSDTPSDNASSDHLAAPLPTPRPPSPPMTRSRSALEKPISSRLRSKPFNFPSA